MNSPMFGTLTTKEMKNVLGGDQTTISTKGSYGNANGGKGTPCPDRQISTWHKDKNGDVIEDSLSCVEYYINGAWR